MQAIIMEGATIVTRVAAGAVLVAASAVTSDQVTSFNLTRFKESGGSTCQDRTVRTCPATQRTYNKYSHFSRTMKQQRKISQSQKNSKK